MEIRKTKVGDIPVILEIYQQARRFMQENGNASQWGDSFPQKEIVEDDIAQNRSYVCLAEDKIVGVFCFIIGEDPTYKKIWNGKWKNEDSYGVIHRLASAQSQQGVAKACITWCKEKCGNIRIDTHQDNLPMRHILEQNGFVHCGNIKVENGSMRIAYQLCH